MTEALLYSTAVSEFLIDPLSATYSYNGCVCSWKSKHLSNLQFLLALIKRCSLFEVDIRLS